MCTPQPQVAPVSCIIGVLARSIPTGIMVGPDLLLMGREAREVVQEGVPFLLGSRQTQSCLRLTKQCFNSS